MRLVCNYLCFVNIVEFYFFLHFLINEINLRVCGCVSVCGSGCLCQTPMSTFL